MLSVLYSERASALEGARIAGRWARGAAVALGAMLVSLAAAWLLLQPNGEFVLLCGIFLGTLALLAARNVGVAAAVAVVGVLNGFPGIDLESFSRASSFRLSDVIVVFLGVVLAVLGLERGQGRDRATRLAWTWALVFLGWWLFTLLRTVLFEEVPFLQAALFGRDFLYFGLLLPLFVSALRERREVTGFLLIVAAAGAWHALANGAIVALGVQAGWLVHPILTNEYLGLPRIYAYMTEATVLALPLGAGLALLATRPAVRLAGAAMFALSAAGVLLQFGRMLYYSAALGLFFAVAAWTMRPTVRSTPLRRTVAGLAALIVVVVSFSVASGGIRAEPSEDSAVSAVSQRAVSGFEEIAAGTGTVRYREGVTARMQDRLAGHWAEGLGFLHPAVRPVTNLPSDSIRNSDVGVFNSLMTMGLVGTVLLYVPLVAVAWALLRAGWRRGMPPSSDWLAFGVTAWIAGVLAGSISLATLFSVPGLVLTACVLGAALRLLSVRDEPADRPAVS